MTGAVESEGRGGSLPGKPDRIGLI